MPEPIYLPSPSHKGVMVLEEAIARRRSVRDFTAEPVSQAQLSQILWAAQGITELSWKLRSAPSAGATYPLEIFVVCGRIGVEGIDEGVYHYDIDSHTLTLHYDSDVRLDLARAALEQDFIHQTPVDVVICASYDRTLKRYGQRGARYVHMEVGHAGQNIHLQATALGLATVVIGAFDDDQVRQALRLDRQYEPLYIMPVGKPVP